MQAAANGIRGSWYLKLTPRTPLIAPNENTPQKTAKNNLDSNLLLLIKDRTIPKRVMISKTLSKAASSAISTRNIFENVMGNIMKS